MKTAGVNNLMAQALQRNLERRGFRLPAGDCEEMISEILEETAAIAARITSAIPSRLPPSQRPGPFRR